MKTYRNVLFIVLISKSVLLSAYNLNEDPQREDTNLQKEQTRDIQFEEDQSFRQERELGR